VPLPLPSRLPESKNPILQGIEGTGFRIPSKLFNASSFGSWNGRNIYDK
jgi:hypothetical protein